LSVAPLNLVADISLKLSSLAIEKGTAKHRLSDDVSNLLWSAWLIIGSGMNEYNELDIVSLI
jgi:hypothetical protein